MNRGCDTLAGAPGRRRRGDWLRQIELDTEEAAGAAKLICEHSLWVDFHCPDIRHRLSAILRHKHILRELIRRKFLPDGSSRVQGIAAILRELVFRSVLVPVVVLQTKPTGRAGNNPGPRTVVADMKWNTDLVRGAATHMHDEAFAREARIRLHRRAGDPALERFSAKSSEARKEPILGRARSRCGSASAKEKKGED